MVTQVDQLEAIIRDGGFVAERYLDDHDSERPIICDSLTTENCMCIADATVNSLAWKFSRVTPSYS